MAERLEMFEPTGGFRGWAIEWNHAECGADPCCHGNEIWARCGDPVAYRLVKCTCCFGTSINDDDLWPVKHQLLPRPQNVREWYCFQSISLFVPFFLSFFVSLLARLRENSGSDLHEIFREGVEWPWDDLITFLVNSEKPRDAAMRNTGRDCCVFAPQIVHTGSRRLPLNKCT